MEGSKVRETEVNKMMSEVSEVITSHLNNFVDRFEQNNKTNNYVTNLHMVNLS